MEIDEEHLGKKIRLALVIRLGGDVRNAQRIELKTRIRIQVTISCLTAVVGFTDQDYRCKSVAIQISHKAGLAPVRSAKDRARDCCLRSSYSAFAPQRLTAQKNIG